MFRDVSSIMYSGISKIKAKSITLNFNAQGRPRWKKRKGRYSHPILDYTGLMRDTAEMSAYSWQQSGRFRIMTIKTPHYGLYHQYAVETSDGKGLAKRVFVRLLVSERQAIKKRFSLAMR